MGRPLGLIIALLLVTSSIEARKTLFASNKEYKYDVYGHFLTSAPDVANQYVGLGIKAKAHVQAQSEDSVIFKLENVQAASLNQRLANVDEDDIPWQMSEGHGALATHLQRPLRVHYNKGTVQSVEAAAEEPQESLNIKFAMISLLQLNLDESAKSSSPFSSSSKSSFSRNSLASSNNNNNNNNNNNDDGADVFTVMEDGIGGECETSYIVESNPSAENPDADVVNVTKVLNYRNCNSRPEWVRTTHVPNECPDCEADKQHPLSTVTVIEYDVKDNGRELIIEYVEAEGKTVFAPFTAESDTLEANHTLTLNLVRVGPISTNAPSPLNSKTHNSLKFKFPTAKRALQEGPRSLKRPITPFVSDEKFNALPAAKQFLEVVASKMVNEATHEQGPQGLLYEVYELIRYIRMLSYDEVAQLFNDVVKRDSSRSSSTEDRKQVFVDASVMSGSPPAILHTKFLIESQQLKGEQAVQAVQAISTNLLEPTYEIVSEILNLAKSRVAREDSQLYKTSWLTFALLVSQACDGPNDDAPALPTPPHIKTFCPQDVERKYIQELNQHLRAAQNKEETLLFLRALGATQTPTAIPYLKKYAEGRYDDDESIRATALRALRNVAPADPDRVLDIAEAIFHNTDNPDPVRIAALRAMLASQPDFEDLQKVAARNDDEPSDDVAGYVLSAFDSLANSSNPCQKDISNSVSQLLSLLDEEDENGIQGSNFYESSQYDEDTGFGTQTVVSVTGSNSSVIPEAVNMHINNTIGGHSYQPLKVTIQSKGLQTILDNTIGPVAAFKKINSLADIFKPEEEEPDKQRTSINNKLNLDTRTEDPFFLSAYVKIMDTQARSFYIDHKSIAKLLQSGSGLNLRNLQSGLPIHYHKFSLHHEIMYQAPSILGVPIVLTIATPSLISVRGHVSAQLDTSASHSGSQLPGNLQIQADIRASYTSLSGSRLGTYNPFEKTISSATVATSTYFALPVKAEANLNPMASKVSLSIKPSQVAASSSSDGAIKLFHFKVHPYTCHYPLFNPSEYCQNSKTIHATRNPDVAQINLNRQKAGLPLVLKSRSEHEWNDMGSFLDAINDFEDVISFANSWWVTPEFAARQYELFLDSRSSANNEIDMSAEFKYTPTPSEQLVLENKRSPKGFWTVLSGFAKLPDQCDDNSNNNNNNNDNDDDNYNDDDENDDDKQSTQYSSRSMSSTSNKNKNVRNAKSSRRSNDDFDSFNHDQVNNNDDNDDNDDNDQAFNRGLPYSSNLRSGSSNSGVTLQKLSRKREVEALEIRVKAASKGSSAAKFLGTLSLKRDNAANTDAVSLTVDMINIPALSNSQVQVCATGAAKYPDQPCTVEEQLEPSNVKPIVANMQVSWGSQCSSASPQISIKAKAEKTREQEELESQKSEWYFEQCKEDIEHGKKLTDACEEAINEVSSLNKITVTAEFSKLPSWLENATRKVDTCLKYHLYKQMTNNPVNVDNGEGRLKVVARFHDEVPAMDLLIFKPKENTFFHKVSEEQLPFFVGPLSTQSSIVEDTIDDLTNGYESPSCEIMGKHVNTFDNVTLKIPLTSCQHVIAKDCSPHDLFAVTMASAGNKQKTLNVFLLNHKITVKPQGNSGSGEFSVDVDGQSAQPSNDDEAIAVKSHNSDAEGKIIALISTTGPTIHVQAPHHGLEVEFDGEDAQITVSNLWRGKLCGLCGEFREDSDNALTGPRQCEYPDPISFGLSYGLPSGQCQLPSPPNKNKICDDNSSSSRHPNDDNNHDDNDDDDDNDDNDNDEDRNLNNQDDYDNDDEDNDNNNNNRQSSSRANAVRRNQVKTQSDRQCFSVEPQLECQNGSREKNVQQKKVGFHCLPRNSPKAHKLLEARDDRILREIANEEVHLYDQVSVPENCVQ